MNIDRDISRKESALRVLGPLGFEDAGDCECPGAIWHPRTFVRLNAATLRPEEFVYELLRLGGERSVAALRRDLRAALGL